MNFLKAQKLMKSKHIDAMLISSIFNFFYATDFYDQTIRLLSESRLMENGVIIPVDGEPSLLINDCLLENFQDNKKIRDIRTYQTRGGVVRSKPHDNFAKSWIDGVIKILKEKGLESAKIGIERKHVSVNTWEKLNELLPKANFENDIEDILWSLRSVKTPAEIEKMEKAIKVTEKAMKRVFDSVKIGTRDADLIKKLKEVVSEEELEMSHANWGVGPRSGEMFSSATGHKISKGDVVRLDIGVENKGYRSDLARIAVVGSAPPNLKQLYNVLLEAEREAIQKIKPGVAFSDVYETVISTVRKRGYPKFTRGMVGHCVGLECEEFPLVSSNSKWVFEKGMVLCIEVPWYEPGLGGVMVEDTILVTDEGIKELSQMDRHLIEL